MAAKYRRQPQYQYRGRRSRGSSALKVVIALLVLLLLAGVIFVVVLDVSVEYTDDGVKLVLPWSEGQGGQTGETGKEPPTIVIEDPDETGSPEPDPEPEPDSVPETVGAVEVTVEQLLDGTAVRAAESAGADTLVIEMKPASGILNWDSAVQLAVTEGAVADNGAAVSAAVAQLAQEGEYHLVARVVCFRDRTMANAGVGGPLRTRGGVGWYDYYGLCWVSPVSEEIRTYLTQLCLELARMGFDEILLECGGYPYFGETHVLATDELRPEDLTGPVARFWQEAVQALEGTGVKLSALVTEEMVLGTDTYSGIGAELLAGSAYRVWVDASDRAACITALTRAGMEQAELRLVLPGDGTAGGSWAQIDPGANQPGRETEEVANRGVPFEGTPRFFMNGHSGRKRKRCKFSVKQKAQKNGGIFYRTDSAFFGKSVGKGLRQNPENVKIF